MATQPRLVNKQFNSPIGLYSEQNVREVIDRETQILSNGAVGVNFYNPGVGKPANLQNSAVLRMLEEEENRQRNGHHPSNDYAPKSLRENTVWPPREHEIKNQIRGVFKDTVVPGVKRVAWPPPQDSGEFTEQEAVQAQAPAQASAAPGRQQSAPAPAPAPAPAQKKVVEPPPATITLRPQAPVSQAPAPLITSQPATATLRGGKHLRGDLKWPPEDVKKLMEEERLKAEENSLGSTYVPSGKHLRGDLKWPPEDVRARMEQERKHEEEIAMGPAVRPPKNIKDYSSFYDQNRLNDTYPRYVIPPGTQFFRPV